MRIGIEHAIRALHPGAQFTMVDDDITEWNSSGITQPTEDEINIEITRLQGLEPARLVREKRDQLLNESDWTQTRDNVRLNDSAWITYRQELRDITKSASFTPKLNDDGTLDQSSVTWPLKPST